MWQVDCFVHLVAGSLADFILPHSFGLSFFYSAGKSPDSLGFLCGPKVQLKVGLGGWD